MYEYMCMCILLVTVPISQFIQRRHLTKGELIWSTGEIMTGETEVLGPETVPLTRYLP